eukprot:gene25016-30218_t
MAQESDQDMSVLHGWLHEEGASSAGGGEVHPEDAVKEMGLRFRSKDGYFAKGYAKSSGALQRRVLTVIDMLCQALRHLGGEGLELSAQLSEHVLAATVTACTGVRQGGDEVDAFGALRLACVDQLVAAASASSQVDQRGDLLRRAEEPLLLLGSGREPCELWGDVLRLRGDASLSLCIYAACFHSHGDGSQNAHMRRLVDKIEQQQARLRDDVDVRGLALDEVLPFVHFLRKEGLVGPSAALAELLPNHVPTNRGEIKERGASQEIVTPSEHEIPTSPTREPTQGLEAESTVDYGNARHLTDPTITESLDLAVSSDVDYYVLVDSNLPKPPTLQSGPPLPPKKSELLSLASLEDFHMDGFDEPEANLVDIDRLSSLVACGEEEVDALRGKDVVLIIGKTGVGKSTFIQFIHGVKFSRFQHGGKLYDAVNKEEVLEEFVIGHMEKSTTKQIRSYASPSGLVFCDLPGYKDTDDYNVDVATSLWIRKIACICKSLRFVFLIHYAALEENRGEPFRDLMKLISGLINEKYEAAMRSSLILFTHLSDRQPTEREESEALEAIQKKIEAVGNGKQGCKRTMFMSKLIVLLKVKNLGHVRVFNPATSKAQEYFDFIRNTLLPFADSSENVKCSLAAEVNLAVTLAINKLETSINEALISSLPDRQAELPRLLRLAQELEAMLDSSATLSNILRAVMEKIAIKMKIYHQKIFAVLDRVTLENSSHKMLLGEQEIFEIIPLLRQLKTFCQVTMSHAQLGGSSKSLDVVQELYIEYRKRRLLLALAIHTSLQQSSRDYEHLYRLLSNVRSLHLLEKEFYADTPSPSLLPSVVTDLLPAFRSAVQASAGSVYDHLEGILRCLKSTSISAQRLFVCTRVVSLAMDKARDLEQLSKDNFEELAPTFCALFSDLESRFLHSLAEQSYDCLVDMLFTGIKESLGLMSRALENGNEYDFSCLGLHLQYFEELHRFKGCFNDLIPAELSKNIEGGIEQFDVFLAERIADCCGVLVVNLFQLDFNAAGAFAHVSSALSSNPSVRKLCWQTTSKIEELSSALEDDIKAKVNTLSKELTDAIHHRRHEEIQKKFHLLHEVVSNIAPTCPGYEGIRAEYNKAWNEVEFIVAEYSNHCLRSFREPPMCRNDFKELSLASEEEYVYMCSMVSLSVADKHGYIKAKYDVGTIFPEDSSLAKLNESEEFKAIIKSKQLLARNFSISFDQASLVALTHLKALRWFDVYNDSDRAVKDVLVLVADGCMTYWQSFCNNFKAPTLNAFEDEMILELKKLRPLAYLLNDLLGISLSADIEALRNVLAQRYETTRAEHVAMIPSSTDSDFIPKFPFEFAAKVNRFLSQLSAVLNFSPVVVLPIMSSVEGLLNDFQLAVKMFCENLISFAALAEAQLAVSKCECLLLAASRIMNFNNSGKSFLEVSDETVNHLVDRIQSLVNSAYDSREVEDQLLELSKYTAISPYLKTDVNKLYQTLYASYLTSQSTADAEVKEKIKVLDFKDLRRYLDQYNNKSNIALYKKYEDNMTLALSIVAQYLKLLQDNYSCGKMMVEGISKLEGILCEIGGKDGKYDHLKEYGNIDLQKEIDDLRQKKSAHLKSEVAKLSSLQKVQQIDQLVICADKLETYCAEAQNLIEASVQNSIKTAIAENVLNFLHFSVGQKPRSDSLYEKITNMLLKLIHQHPLKAEGGEVDILSLSGFLTALSHLEGQVQSPQLKSLSNYGFWKTRIAQLINTALDTVERSAEADGTVNTALTTLQYAQANLTSGFIGHFDGMIDIAARVSKAEDALQRYNASKDSAFQTVEGCERYKRLLDRQKKIFGTGESYYDLQWSNKRVSFTSPNEYALNVQCLQTAADRLVKDVEKALLDNNHDLVCKSFNCVLNVDKILYMHLNVLGGFKKISGQVNVRFEQLRDTLTKAVQAGDIVMFRQQFNNFSFIRESMVSMLLFEKKHMEDCSKLHLLVAETFESLQPNFRGLLKAFKFEDVAKFQHQFEEVRYFIASTNFKAYCNDFIHTHYYELFRYMRDALKRPAHDHSLERLAKVGQAFITPAEEELEIDNVHVVLLNQVKEILHNFEYFKLGAILNCLLNFHLLMSKGAGKDKIDGTKASVNALIKGNLESIRADIAKYWQDRDWQELNNKIQLLLAAENELKHFSGYVDSTLLQNIYKELETNLYDIGNQAINVALSDVGDVNERIRDFAVKIADLGKVYDQVQAFHGRAKIQINRVLNHCREQLGLGFIFKLGVVLEEGDVFDNDGDKDAAIRVGRRIVGDFHHFKDVATMVWNKRVAQHSVEESLNNLITTTSDFNKKVPLDKKELSAMYSEYKAKYDDLVLKYISSNSNNIEIVEYVHQVIAKMQPCSVSTWGKQQQRELPKALAGIFAYYTIIKSGDSYNSLAENDEQNAADILLTPHHVQVIAIFRLLGCADGLGASLRNQLMQIGTGEGKSIILGALSVLFALLGFEVRCVCYSEYLSSRDYGDFKVLFAAFNCLPYISYSKITTFSEYSVARQGNIRQLTSDLILGKPLQSLGGDGRAVSNEEEVTDEGLHDEDKSPAAVRENRELVLLVDEVDVFFGKDFYGQTYNQVTKLSTPYVNALIRFIWKERKNDINLRILSATSDYQALVQALPEWKALIDRELQLMCMQVKSFDKIPYIYSAEQDKIGYIEHDSVSYSLTYGYCTVFAYLNELEKGSVRQNNIAAFDDHLTMLISCGQFSYANINPDCIIGVSGTITALTDYEKEVMSRYKIEQHTFSPSVYGKKNLVFDHVDTGVYLADDKADFLKSLVNAINDISRTKDASKKKYRAIIVFFESLSRLEEFRTSEYFRQVIENTSVNCLTEELSADARDYIIKKAATVGQVTLATKVFGRGTDFISRDQALNDRGGVHVLQTFLSEMESEEIQIQGRSARQGQAGSFSLLLLLQDELLQDSKGKKYPKHDTLAYFRIDANELSRVARGDRYRFLCAKRNEKRMEESKEIEHNLSEAQLRDAKTREYFSALLSNDSTSAKSIFVDLYTLIKGKNVVVASDFHVVFVLDESGSMSGAPFAELTAAYKNFVAKRQALKNGDIVSVVMFSGSSRVIASCQPISNAPSLPFSGGGTAFAGALARARDCISAGSNTYAAPVVIFMTDGGCGDLPEALQQMRALDEQCAPLGLQVHLVAFGGGASIDNLNAMSSTCTRGFVHTAGMGELENTFQEIEQSLYVAEYN